MRFVLISLLLVGLQASAATVYRSVDEEGNVQYSDRPVGDAVERVVVRTARARVSRSATAPRSLSNSVQQPTAEDEEKEQEEAARAADIAEQRAENCQIAKERLERYITSRRLYKVGADGERAYLNDAELDEARAKAQADVEEWCG